MSVDSLKATLGLLDIINKTYASVNENKRINAEYQNYDAKLNSLAGRKAIEQENKTMAELTAAKASNDLKVSKTNIKDRVDDLRQWNISLDNIDTGLKSHLKTQGFEDFANFSINDLDENLTFDYQIANDSKTTYENMTNAANANAQVISALDGMMMQVEGLKSEVANVGFNAGIQEIQDYADFETYVNSPDNAALFKLPKLDANGNPLYITHDDGSTSIDYSENNNYLGDAFLREQTEVDKNPIGYVPTQTDINAAILQRGTEEKKPEFTQEQLDDMSLMEVNQSLIDNSFNLITSADFTNLPDDMKKSMTDLSGLNISTNYLSKDAGYNKEEIYSRGKELYNLTAKNIDTIFSYLANDIDPAGFNVRDWVGRGVESNYPEIYKAYEMGLFEGNYRPGESEAHMIGGFDSEGRQTYQGYIGGKGQDGLFVYKNDLGNWTFDEDKYRAVAGKIGDDSSEEVIKYLSQNILMAKKLQDASPLDIGYLHSMDSDAFQKALEYDLKLKNGEIEQYEADAYYQGIMNNNNNQDVGAINESLNNMSNNSKLVGSENINMENSAAIDYSNVLEPKDYLTTTPEEALLDSLNFIQSQIPVQNNLFTEEHGASTKVNENLTSGQAWKQKYMEDRKKPVGNQEQMNRQAQDRYIQENYPNMKAFTSEDIYKKLANDPRFQKLDSSKRVDLRSNIISDVIDMYGNMPEEDIHNLDNLAKIDNIIEKFLSESDASKYKN
tara:strand:- start:12923 stop:15106 length:2184 start_codon:yes stop_codon:yes gene_type:complete